LAFRDAAHADRLHKVVDLARRNAKEPDLLDELDERCWTKFSQSSGIATPRFVLLAGDRSGYRFHVGAACRIYPLDITKAALRQSAV
jgi:hypothetical protein